MNYYLTNFSLYYDLKKDPFQFDNVMPFEKQLYMDLLLQRLQEEEQNKNNGGSPPTKEEMEGYFHNKT